MNSVKADNEDDITVLLPCLKQRPEYLKSAVNSVLLQTSRYWRLLALIEPTTPDNNREMLRDYQRTDSRIEVVECGGQGMGAALNLGLTTAQTDFVALLLSDDEFEKRALAKIQKARQMMPDVDFLHSGLRLIGPDSEDLGRVRMPRPDFEISEFWLRGSPVRHLMAWNREASLAAGGFNESLPGHGVDDYDFPWRMAEGGLKFRVLKDVLYRYRLHHRGPRLTLDLPLEEQIETLRKMFHAHGRSETETAAFLRRAERDYLWQDKFDRAPYHALGPTVHKVGYRLVPAARQREFSVGGIAPRYTFGHRLYLIPKAGPDAVRLAGRAGLSTRADRVFQLLLVADRDVQAKVSDELWFDPELNWHRLHLGRPGVVASASLLRGESTLFGLTYVSDVVSRISRRREDKTRVDKVFKGWPEMLVNGVLNVALELGLSRVCSATSKLVMDLSDPSRSVDGRLFERVYDRPIRRYHHALREGRWWELNTTLNLSRIVPAEKGLEQAEERPTVCLFFDIEEELGHRELEPEAEISRIACQETLARVLRDLAELNIKATFNVVGTLLPAKRAAIEKGGHALAFHSYDHKLETFVPFQRVRRRLAGLPPYHVQLDGCQNVDYQIRGYRPPCSRMEGLDSTTLLYYNTEWLASSVGAMKSDQPSIREGVARIPIRMDDYPLYKGEIEFDRWSTRLLEEVATSRFFALSLHDCYSRHWLHAFPYLLQEIARVAQFKTADQVADSLFWSAAL